MTVLTGMAKPRPTLPAPDELDEESEAAEYIAELMPTMLPFMSISAPPELPGFRDASVWIALYVVVEEPVSPLNWRPPNENGHWPLSPPCCCWPWLSSVETVTSRSRAETMPLVTVPVRPSGEPIATTSSPTWTPSELPRVATFRPEGAFATSMSARSFLLSVPTTFAV